MVLPIIAVMGAIASAMGFVTFIEFMFEEALQTMGMGIWVLISAKNWKSAQSKLRDYQDMITAMENAVNTAGWLSPLNRDAFAAYVTAAKSQANSYAEVIVSKGHEPAQPTKIATKADIRATLGNPIPEKTAQDPEILSEEKREGLEQIKDEYADARTDLLHTKNDMLTDLREDINANLTEVTAKKTRKEITAAQATDERAMWRQNYRSLRDDILTDYKLTKAGLRENNTLARKKVIAYYKEIKTGALMVIQPPIPTPIPEPITPPIEGGKLTGFLPIGALTQVSATLAQNHQKTEPFNPIGITDSFSVGQNLYVSVKSIDLPSRADVTIWWDFDTSPMAFEHKTSHTFGPTSGGWAKWWWAVGPLNKRGNFNVKIEVGSYSLIIPFSVA